MSRARGRIRRVALVGRSHRPAVGRRLANIEIWLKRRRIDVTLVRGGPAPGGTSWLPNPDAVRAARESQLVIALGGDGTILAGARMVAGTRVPVLPVNLGGLGYLASFEGSELERAAALALEGRLVAVERSLLGATHEPWYHGSKPRARRQNLGLALNDVVLKQATTSRALRFTIRVGEQSLGALVADGVVVASPSGSTAYSLSAGGPVLDPDLDGFVVTPICAHATAARSLVLPAGHAVSIQILAPDGAGGIVSLDGQEGSRVRHRDTIHVVTASKPVRFLRDPNAPHAARLVSMLGWTSRPRSGG